ncbi:MAG: DegT/DnrJ/EryC1/StrS family aminotransferase [Lachnospiraceae bacterium]|nr:DegT/DnrJ/EryC1/StrS family aminotransferase [Lachnospiraceae bacterium]
MEKVRELCASLKEKGIESRPFWKPVHLQAPYVNAPHRDVSHAESIWNRIITLPCSTGITDDELQVVVSALVSS